MIVTFGAFLRFTLNIFSNLTYSYCQVHIPKLYKHVTAMTCGLNRLEGMLTDLQDIHWAALRSASSCRLTFINHVDYRVTYTHLTS